MEFLPIFELVSSSADQVAHLPTDLLQRPLTATLLTSILAAVLGSLQIGYHTGNINAPAKVRHRDGIDVQTLALKV